jgi:acetylornithine deacetylase/succinyl-diaminopimelate desuccinylase-like protein
MAMRAGEGPLVSPLGDAERQQWIASASALLDSEWMLRALVDAVNVPSPTGEERPMAEHFAARMRNQGLQARVQPIDAACANAIGQLGEGAGPSVMLFAPLDSATTGIAEEEVPWIGPELPPEHRPEARVEGTAVSGLAANNSKAHIVASIAAAAAIARAGVPLAGRIVLAFGAGGAPTHKRPSLQRSDIGLGAGCEHLLRQGVRADFAIVTKPGFTVQWEEPGLCWFRVRIHGVQSYAGRKHQVPDANPILRAGRVIPLLENWLQAYAERHTTGLVAPQGVIGAIEGGWTYKPAFTPAACDLFVDLRIAPDTTPMQAWRELTQALGAIRAALGADAPPIDCEMVASVTGPSTPRDAWIVRSCTQAWEAVAQRSHVAATHTSGQTEAVILRRHGIPTARVGLPTHVLPNGEHTMGVATVEGMASLARVLLHALVDTCTRSLSEVGLTPPLADAWTEGSP